MKPNTGATAVCKELIADVLKQVGVLLPDARVHAFFESGFGTYTVQISLTRNNRRYEFGRAIPVQEMKCIPTPVLVDGLCRDAVLSFMYSFKEGT